MRRIALVVVAVLALAGCGSDESEPSSAGEAAPAPGSVTEELFAGSAADNRADPAEGGKRGGKLTVLAAGDVDFLDPQKTWYLYAYGIINAVHRGLYAYLPGDTTRPVPDLAESDPQISSDGRTVTVRIRRGVMFSAPVSREVTSSDVKYGIERAFMASVANGYAPIYFGDLVGAPSSPGPHRDIRGIETPDDRTIVFKLTRGTGAALAGALAMPISVPVPQEFAARYDRESPSTYGEERAVYTGPYMVAEYEPGRRIHLVRNPDYRNVGDFRPAFLDEIELLAGNEDTGVATRRILAGESLAAGDFSPPATQLKRLLEENKQEVSAVPGGGWRMISMDTSRPPFDDLDVRKAVIAGFDRVAARQQRGGEALGPIAQHMIPPGMAGFEESNGADGWVAEMDWMSKPAGDRAVAEKYMKAAGFDSGAYEGDRELLIVSDGAEPDRSIAQITEQQLREMGFKTKLRLVTRDTMITRFCGVPASEVNVCPSGGWGQDFADAQTVLDPTFNGESIAETQNANWPELDVPQINRAIDAAKLVTDPQERAEAWAQVNKLVMEQAPVIPFMWDYQPLVASKNVRGVQNGYTTTWDLSFTSLR